MNIGAFVSTAGGLAKMLDRAQALGVNSIMMFSSSPQSWVRRSFSADDLAAFRARFTADGYQSLWTHGGYLMNFATADSESLRKSTECLIAEVNDARALGAQGVIFHLGSHKGRGLTEVVEQIVGALRAVADATDPAVQIVLENSAGMGGSIGSSFAELGQIIGLLKDDRFKVCLDTQHAFAAGYALHTSEGLEKALDEFEREIGLTRLVVLHANDSKVPFAGGRDRHENIGLGYIGDDGWKVMTHNAVLNKLPFLLEVPGLEGNGPDKPNVDRLRSLGQ